MTSHDLIHKLWTYSHVCHQLSTRTTWLGLRARVGPLKSHDS